MCKFRRNTKINLIIYLLLQIQWCCDPPLSGISANQVSVCYRYTTYLPNYLALMLLFWCTITLTLHLLVPLGSFQKLQDHLNSRFLLLTNLKIACSACTPEKTTADVSTWILHNFFLELFLATSLGCKYIITNTTIFAGGTGCTVIQDIWKGCLWYTHLVYSQLQYKNLPSFDTRQRSFL